MLGDTPSIASAAYGSNTSVLGLAAMGMNNLGAQNFGVAANALSLNPQDQLYKAALQANAAQRQQPKELPMATRRLVKVIIVDPNENVPMEDCVLFSGDEKLTDATDQELFFEVDIKKILEDHNAKRVKVADKKVKERVEFLEPAKIRDLKMVVVNIATF